MNNISFEAIFAAALEAEGGSEEGDEVGSDEMHLKYRRRDGGEDVVLFSSWLSHQNIFDDFRLCNERFVEYDFGHVGGKAIVVEQNFKLGKPGIGWDSAYILTEHILKSVTSQKQNLALRNDSDCDRASASSSSPSSSSASLEKLLSCPRRFPYHLPSRLRTYNENRVVVVELGCGLGIAGLAIAKAVPGLDVFMTDLDPIIPLATSNAEMNSVPFLNETGGEANDDADEDDEDEDACVPTGLGSGSGCEQPGSCDGPAAPIPVSPPPSALLPPPTQSSSSSSSSPSPPSTSSSSSSTPLTMHSSRTSPPLPSAMSVSPLPWGRANTEEWMQRHLLGALTHRRQSTGSTTQRATTTTTTTTPGVVATDVGPSSLRSPPHLSSSSSPPSHSLSSSSSSSSLSSSSSSSPSASSSTPTVDLVIGADLVVPGLYDDAALVETIATLNPKAVLLVSRVRRTRGLDPFLAKLRSQFQHVEVSLPDSLVKHPDPNQFVLISAWGRASVSRSFSSSVVASTEDPS